MKRTMPVQLLTRYIRDAQFRSLAGIYIGLTVDILYAAFRAIVGLRYGSRWFLSMAVYYAVLGMLRAYLIFGMRRAAPLGGSERLIMNIPATAARGLCSLRSMRQWAR